LAPVSISTSAVHVLVEQLAEKNVGELGDADSETAGQQIDNLGYPGFSAGGGYWELGLTVTVYLRAKEQAP
jgi:hypothetical protein